MMRKQQPQNAASTNTHRPKTHMHASPSVCSNSVVEDDCVVFVRFCGRASPARHGQVGWGKPGTSSTSRWSLTTYGFIVGGKEPNNKL
jgi:hypothetical protein